MTPEEEAGIIIKRQASGEITNPKDPLLKEITDSGQQAGYLVLSAEERAKGFIRPVHDTYIHVKCGAFTTMGRSIAETYARDPTFYGGTFCSYCGAHFNLKDVDGKPSFLWKDGSGVGD